MSKELVSVVIPVFNGAPFVAKAVASVRSQGHPAVEILVVDDGSTDGTPDILKRLEQSDGIRWFQRSHGGPARSRNFGIEAAQGQFIALLDCDDEWLPGKLAAQLALMRQRPDVGLVHTDFEVRFEDGTLEERVSARSSRDPMAQAFVGGHVTLPSTLLIRNTVLSQVGGLDPELYGSEDSDLIIRLFQVTTFECIDQVLVKKLQRGHGYRDMAFDEHTHRERVLASRERFLRRLQGLTPLTAAQQTALDHEWANYFLGKGAADEREGRRTEARRHYWESIRRAPTRLRGYTRWLRTLRP
jgi:glycosyltransferase involved in cell wall biosynthesis